MYRFIIYWIVVLFVVSCKDIPVDNPQKFSPIWEKAFVSSSSTTINPIFSNGFIVYSPYDDPAAGQSASSKFIALDPESGETQWEWFNTLKPTNEGFLMTNPIFAVDGTLIFSNGPRVYVLNGENGSTIWQKQFGDFSSNELYLIDNQLFFSYGVDFENNQYLIKIDRLSGEAAEFINFIYPDTVVEIASGFIINANSMIYTISRNNIHEGNNFIYSYVANYDLENHSKFFETQITEAGWLSDVTQFHQYNTDIVLATAGKIIAAVSIESGELLWTTNVKGSHTFAPLLITDTGLVYSNTDDKVYCIEGTTGEILWQVEPDRHGISSRMVLHKGVLYYVSGGLLYALEANTGEVLLALEAPSALDPKYNMNFQPVMTLDAENDRLYTASYSHAYCYPTIK